MNAQGSLAEAEPLNLSPPSTHESVPCEDLRVPSPLPRQKIKTQLNSFGLFRLYDKDSLPINDPDMATSLDEVDAPALHNNISQPLEIVASGDDPFYPYPNEASLLLGDWYWNQGHQKSQASFRMLLDIIGHPGYSPEDVRKTNWTAIDRKLGNSSARGDKTETDCEWLDHDSGWKKTAIRICVPFHRRTGNPGSKEYIVEDFHYRSLVEIIRENVSDPAHHRLFHYEPYKLHW